MEEQSIKEKTSVVFNGTIRVLHVVKDDKFCDVTLNTFDVNKKLYNFGVLLVKKPNYKFSYIKQTERIRLLWNKRMKKEFFTLQNYDVIYIHSLTPDFFSCFRYIPQNKIVIWWSWGYDIYGGYMGMNPFIRIDKYKPLTLSLHSNSNQTLKVFLRSVKYFIYNIILYKKQIDSIIRRIDFFSPVLPIEYRRMQELSGFRAKEFYPPHPFTWEIKNISLPRVDGSILFGNSATYTNNHLDVWEAIREYIPAGRTVIMPLSYGDKRYASQLKSRIESDRLMIMFLDSMMPCADYFNLIDKCSYAVFGVIRQQAMGNIYQCLQKGTKVFLYRDSIVYQDLKQSGFVVYTIEDIDNNSFTTPLTEDEIMIQSNALKNRRQYLETVSDGAFNIITHNYLTSNEPF